MNRYFDAPRAHELYSYTQISDLHRTSFILCDLHCSTFIRFSGFLMLFRREYLSYFTSRMIEQIEVKP